MVLIWFTPKEHFKKELLLYAFHHRPAIIIDCANWANPHSLFPNIQQEWLHDVYIIDVELLYKFRAVLLEIPTYAEECKAKTIVITPFDGLFHYQNEKENKEVLEHTWTLMYKLSKNYNIVVPSKKIKTLHHGPHYTKPTPSHRYIS